MAERNKDKTRRLILMTAFREFYDKGFAASGISAILEKTGLSKGAFYHHFKSKNELAAAVIDDILFTSVKKLWTAPLADCSDPAVCLKNLITKNCNKLNEIEVFMGCPLNNMGLGFAVEEKEFREKIKTIYTHWIESFAEVLRKGQETGTIRKDIAPFQKATFIIASIAGLRSVAKNLQSKEAFDDCLQGILFFIDNLKTHS